jgi:hypothetical protein
MLECDAWPASQWWMSRTRKTCSINHSKVDAGKYVSLVLHESYLFSTPRQISVHPKTQQSCHIKSHHPSSKARN